MLAGTNANILHQRLSRIARVFDIDAILERKSGSGDIAHYYDSNRLAYRWLHSRKGAVHMALNPDGKFNSRGFAVQPHEVAHLIAEKGCRKVLEAGCCKGFNLKYIARQHTDIRIHGIDISRSNLREAQHRCRSYSNVHIAWGDYHALPFSDSQFDCVFMIETASFSVDHSRLVSEVKRVLKPGGLFLLYDIFKGHACKSADPETLEAVALEEKASMIVGCMPVSDWINLLENNGFQGLAFRNLTQAVMPTLRVFERYATAYFSLLPVARLARDILPSSLTRSTITGYLLPVTMQRGLHCYANIISQLED